MREISLKEMPFKGVGMAMIIFGAILVGICAAAWIMAYFWQMTVISMPFTKLIGGLIIVGLGYLILECEMIRCGR